MNEQHKRQLLALLEDARWGAVEAFYEHFMMTHFAMTSIKRETEFDTVWYAAEHEGAKRMLAQFMKEMENEAKNAKE